jgi:hypothetical protein
MSKVQDFKENFWKRRIATAVVTPFSNGFECNVELYSIDKSFLGSWVIPCYQLREELKCLGFKSLDFYYRRVNDYA